METVGSIIQGHPCYIPNSSQCRLYTISKLCYNDVQKNKEQYLASTLTYPLNIWTLGTISAALSKERPAYGHSLFLTYLDMVVQSKYIKESEWRELRVLWPQHEQKIERNMVCWGLRSIEGRTKRYFEKTTWAADQEQIIADHFGRICGEPFLFCFLNLHWAYSVSQVLAFSLFLGDLTLLNRENML